MSTITRRSFLTASAFSLVSLGLAACSPATSTSSNSSEFESNGPKARSPKAKDANPAKKDGVLIVGFDQEFPPYGYVGDDGVFTGVDLELAAECAARNGWNLQCNPIAWDAKDAELAQGSIDCIWNGFSMKGREDGYTWTDPTTMGGQAVVVRKDSNINSLADLAGKVMLVQTDSAALDLLKDGGDRTDIGKTLKALQTTSDYNTAMMELESGAVDAFAVGSDAARYQIRGREDTYKLLDEYLSKEASGVGFLKGNTELRDAVQKTLIEMTKDGTVEKIYANYTDQGLTYDDWVLGRS